MVTGISPLTRRSSSSSSVSLLARWHRDTKCELKQCAARRGRRRYYYTATAAAEEGEGRSRNTEPERGGEKVQQIQPTLTRMAGVVVERGVVKVPPQQLGQSGVQEHLEEAIKKLKPVNPVSLSVSSRTDAGVHALSNSAHFDLQRKNDKPPFTADVLVEALNFNLKEQQIRVTHAYRVPDDFHARYRAQSRTYVYRVALGATHHTLLPLTDCNLCWSLCNTELDIDAMHEAAALLVGTHDFSSFRAVNSDLPFKNPVKTVDVVAIQPGSSFAHSHFHRRLQFWELTFKSQSFLYKQVRRMAGVLVAAGRGRLSVSQVKQILDARDTLAFPHNVAAPAQGLFLKSVDYKESDLLFSQKPDATEDPKT